VPGEVDAMTRRTSIKGYRVSKTKSGKTILEPIPCYGRDVSAKIRMRNSRKQRVVRRAPT
jgi:hypothetical protein